MPAALFRPEIGQPWQDVEIVGQRADGMLLRETGKHWPGVFIATLDQVRLPGPVFELREPFGNERRRVA